MAGITLTQQASGQRQATSPWLNPKLVAGLVMVALVLVLTLIGLILWDVTLARAASSPLNLPPFWVPGGTMAHPLGTESSGRDLLALLIVGGPMTLQVGLIVGITSMVIGIVLGFAAGYLGGAVDAVIRTLSDTALTIPSLAILIVISAYVRQMDVTTMSLIVALLAWAGPTRVIRAQVLSMREQGYVRMARLTALPTPHIMFREMMPNLLPYLAASFIGSASGGILAAVGLEALGLGPQRIPTLGMTVSQAIQGSAILRGMWWWWGTPTIVLMVIFIGLFLVAIGLDEVVNPRLRGVRG
ncbi:ABC transporter permease [Actinopolymorpha alba]|uniref:ABC transporter permease n=1 Tax=Actinopolymorpha alba TaxID=533267 RepID=UPI00036A1BE6|nr:ABC transporter permease [Actinopolymorpha alba]